MGHSLDFSDTNFHVPVSQSSRKYLRFHCQKQIFQFTALPYGLSTAVMEFAIVLKEVKLMAEAHRIWIYQYLDDWLTKTNRLVTNTPSPSLPFVRNWLCCQSTKIRTRSSSGLRLHRIAVRLRERFSQTHPQKDGKL